MPRLLLSSIRSLLQTLTSSEEKISCYHCAEQSRKSLTVYIHFDHQIRPVCCHGCAAILKTVEELGMHDEYHANKIHISDSDD
jgi:Putative metal-binding domain of cation transport ATPase